MKKVIIELDSYSLKYENTLAIGRGLAEKNIDVQIWNSMNSPMLDMLYEIRPDIVYYHNEIEHRVLNKINSAYPDLKMIDTQIYSEAIIADDTAFKRVDAHPMFICDEVCIIQYPEIENHDSLPFRKRMAITNKNQFRVFSLNKMSGAKFCGWVPKELHPILFSSAKSVLALSRHTASNAILCNTNVTLIENGVEQKFTLSDINTTSRKLADEIQS